MENNQDIIKKIINKKEFSKLRAIDIEKVYSHFSRRQCSDDEKIKLSRDLLRKVFSAFTSQKILSSKNKDYEWILRKHLSTRERLPYYDSVYSRIFKHIKEASLIDLGAGINGFSYDFLERLNLRINYLGIESIGQLVDLMNDFFIRENKSAKAIHLSLFEFEEIKKEIEKTKPPRFVFLFKTLDSLEMLEADYSKKIISELSEISDFIVISFATRSMIKKTRFKANRNWIISFVKENFEIEDEFEIGNERYLIFRTEKKHL